MEYLIVRNNKATPKNTWVYLTATSLRKPTATQAVLLSSICDSYEFVHYDSTKVLKAALKKDLGGNDYAFSINGDELTFALVP